MLTENSTSNVYTTERFLAAADTVDRISKDDCNPAFFAKSAQVSARLRAVSGLPHHRGNQELLSWVALMVTLPLPCIGQADSFSRSKSICDNLLAPFL